jgi:hypothetical protein
MKSAILVLEDGRTFHGESFGAPRERREQKTLASRPLATAPRSWRPLVDVRQEQS